MTSYKFISNYWSNMLSYRGERQLLRLKNLDILKRDKIAVLYKNRLFSLDGYRLNKGKILILVESDNLLQVKRIGVQQVEYLYQYITYMFPYEEGIKINTIMSILKGMEAPSVVQTDYVETYVLASEYDKGWSYSYRIYGEHDIHNTHFNHRLG